MPGALQLSEFLGRMKSIIALARKYRVRSGLKVSFLELDRIYNDLVREKRDSLANDTKEIIEFLKEEEALSDERRRVRSQKIGEIASEIPVGMLISFRDSLLGTLTGELKGYLADRALVEVKNKYESRIFEVDPFDIKL